MGRAACLDKHQGPGLLLSCREGEVRQGSGWGWRGAVGAAAAGAAGPAAARAPSRVAAAPSAPCATQASRR